MDIGKTGTGTKADDKKSRTLVTLRNMNENDAKQRGTKGGMRATLVVLWHQALL